MKIVAYLNPGHAGQCAVHDPDRRGACDCGARQVPLVTLASAQAEIADLRAALAAEVELNKVKDAAGNWAADKRDAEIASLRAALQAAPKQPDMEALREKILALKRFHLVDPQEGEADMEEAADGWWLSYEDVANLVAASRKETK